MPSGVTAMVRTTRQSAEVDAVAASAVAAKFTLGDQQLMIVSLHGGTRASESSDIGEIGEEIGRFRLGGAVYAVVRETEAEPAPLQDDAIHPLELLTERELQIAMLVAHGRLNKQIAYQLHISEWTVCAHLRRIYAKLQVRSRAAMVFRCATLMGIQSGK